MLAQWSDALAAHLAAAEGHSGSTETRAYYAAVLGDLLRACPPPDGLTPLSVQSWAYSRRQDGRPRAPASIRQRLAVASAFLAACVRWGLIPSNSAAEIPRPRPGPPPIRALTPSQVRRLLDGIAEHCHGARWGRERLWRDRAFVIVGLFTGLRRAELGRISAGMVRDAPVSASGIRFAILRTKGGRVRPVPLPPPALGAIADMMEARGDRLEDLPAAASIWGRVAVDRLARSLGEHGVAAGIGWIAPHQLRHTCAILRLAAGSSILDLQELLGHSRPSTTDGYLRRLAEPRDRTWRAVAGALGLGEPQVGGDTPAARALGESSDTT